MAQNWDSHCNMRAFGLDGAYIENRETITFKSGRTVDYRKNSSERKTFALLFRFDDTKLNEGRTEFEWFIRWFEDVIKGGSVHFYFPDVMLSGEFKEYRISEPPKWKGQAVKEVSMTFEEV